MLVVDELGYLPVDQASANWIFQVVSRRYEKGSIVLTSNRGVGRLLHNATVINVKGHSYRMRSYRDESGNSRAKGGGGTVR